MVERFRRLIPEGTRVLVGYSGGADSTCLLTLLVEAGYPVVAAHLHHGMRDEADREQALCEAYADEIGAEFVSGRADVPRMAQEFGLSTEEAGRQARYHFFERAAASLQCGRIATAHTADDHAETVLLNAIRGAGLRGLAGIPEQRGSIVRPLLGMPRTETRAFCTERGLWFHDDPANEDRQHSRVRVRLDVLPMLEEIQPGARDALTRLAEIAREEDAYLDQASISAFQPHEVALNGELHWLTKDTEFEIALALPSLPRVLAHRTLRLISGALGFELGRVQTSHLLRRMTEEGEGKEMIGPHTVIQWTADRTTWTRDEPVEPFRHPLTVPGETIADVFGWQIAAWCSVNLDFPRCSQNLHVALDQDATRGALYFRSAQDGDRMQTLGLEGTKLLRDALRESGLTRPARRRIPVVCDLVGPVWVPGVALAERVKLTPATRHALHLRFGPIRD